MTKFFILSGRGFPLFLEDEEGNAFAAPSLEAAHRAARGQILCEGFGYIVLEWDDNGLVAVHDP